MDIRVNAIAPVAYTALAQSFLDAVEGADRDASTPDGVAPILAYLAHSGCSISGELISAQASGVARISASAAPGFVQPEMTAEEVAAQAGRWMLSKGVEILPPALAEFPLSPQAQ